MVAFCLRILILIVIAAGVLASGGRVNAKEALRFEPLTTSVRKTDHLVIQGFHGRVVLKSRPESSSLTVKLTQVSPGGVDAQAPSADLFQFTMERDSDRLILRVSGPSEKELMRSSLLAVSQPQFLIEILSPPLPAQVHWWVGEIEVEGWSQELNINLLEGKVVSVGGSGPLRVYLDRGDVQVATHRGDVDVETYVGRVSASRVSGDLRVDNFAGANKIDKVMGQIRLTAFRAPTRASEVKGGLSYDLGEAELALDRIEGPLVGRSDRGLVKASLVGVPQVRLESNQGAVRLRAAGSGAEVSVGSVDGRIQVPAELERVRLPDLVLRQGKLKGPPGGSIFVRTQSGAIQIH